MKKYLLTITSNSTNEREYSVDCRNVLKLANQYGRCEGGEVVIVWTKSGKPIGCARWTDEGGRYYRVTI